MGIEPVATHGAASAPARLQQTLFFASFVSFFVTFVIVIARA